MASKRHQRRKACEGKVKFPDQPAAQHAATSYKYTYHQFMATYRCKFCNHWHIGHPPRRVRQAMAANGFRP